jgi:hypothetical protein
MNKRSEAAAAVWPGPAVPFRLTALVVSCGSEASAASGMTRNTKAVPAVERGQRSGEGRSVRPKMYVGCLASRGLQAGILSPLLAVAQTGQGLRAAACP